MSDRPHRSTVTIDDVVQAAVEICQISEVMLLKAPNRRVARAAAIMAAVQIGHSHQRIAKRLSTTTADISATVAVYSNDRRPRLRQRIRVRAHVIDDERRQAQRRIAAEFPNQRVTARDEPTASMSAAMVTPPALRPPLRVADAEWWAENDDRFRRHMRSLGYRECRVDDDGRFVPLQAVPRAAYRGALLCDKRP